MINFENLQDNGSFCVLPFVHQEKKFNGTYHICCYSDQLQAEENENLTTSIEHFNSQKMQEIRASMVNGQKHIACNYCYKQEQQGIVSPRTRENSTWYNWKDTHLKIQKCLDNFSNNELMRPISYDLRYSNTCTLKCRMCNSSSSSAINSEYKKINGLWPEKFWTIGNHRIDHDVDLHKNIQKIYLAGGEPLVEPFNLELLNKTADYNNEIVILINTSLNLLSDKFVTVLDKFKYLTLVVSIDGTHAVNDYIRHGSNFPIILENIKKLNKHSFMFSTCVSMYNIFNIKELIVFLQTELKEYSYNHSINLVNDIEELFIENVPYELRPNLISYLYSCLDIADEFPSIGIKNCINVLEQSNFDANKFNNFKKYTKLLDMVRNESIGNVVPQLKEYF